DVILKGMDDPFRRTQRNCRRLCRCLANRWAMPIVALLVAVAWPGGARAMDQDRAVKLAREFLASDDGDKREQLSARLAGYDGDIQPVLQKLSANSYKAVEPGYHYEEHFSTPDLHKQHPKDLLYFTVPKSYRPDRSTGLIVFMHGGGNASSRRAPRYFMNFPDED